MIDFQSIKSHHAIEAVLERRGFELRRAAGGFVCCCPIHDEKTPSFSINVKKQLFHCFGCGVGGDVFKLIQELDGALTAKDAAEILEGRPLTAEEQSRPRPTPEQRTTLITERILPQVPQMFMGEQRHFEVVAKQRSLEWMSIRMAQEAGCLRFCKAYDLPAYAVLDVDNPCNIQLRRFDCDKDGKALRWPWGNEPKVMGVAGNWATWPVGLSAALRLPKSTILLVEGTGDFLAGWDVRNQGIIDVVPVAIFGARNRIHDGALPLFFNRDVIISQQHDACGAAATATWTEQLTTAGARPRTWLVPNEGEDLNDFISAGGNVELITTPNAQRCEAQPSQP